MKLIKKTVSKIPFDLHDSRIVKMEVNDDNLTLHLDQVYEYHKDSEKFYPANLTFTDIDLKECHALVFDKGMGNGAFSGVRYNLQEYLEKYPDAEFEIITDTYNMTTTVMEGYIYRDGQEAVAGIISLWTLGEVIAEF
ncbi:MAG: hypothetical protein SPF31_00930 [Lactobacillus delbrueckii]|nr:hypothetical protein [Lactobacillus delbrueckii]MDY5602309.1 hypothetical protein [Lactobacillus delbrueckii]